jgi:DnaK suppressor protein
MTDTHRQPIVDKLNQRHDALRAELMRLLSESEGLTEASAAPQVRDWKDTAFTHQLTGLNSTAIGQLRDELAEVSDALTRVAEGSYGTCTECGRPIASERLAVQPAAGRCLDCQSRAEQQQ